MDSRIQLAYDLAAKVWSRCAPFNAGVHPCFLNPLQVGQDSEGTVLEGAICILQDLLDQLDEVEGEHDA